jgi:hypothetical protein
VEELSQHILDIIQNSVTAGASRVSLRISESSVDDSLVIRISDNGKGMSEHTCEKATNPFFTTGQTRRVGLGLPLLDQAARATEGHLTVKSGEGTGTTVTAVFGRSHVDRQPMGDLPETLLGVIIANSQVELDYCYKSDGRLVAHLNTQDLVSELKGMPVHSAEGIGIVRKCLEEVGDLTPDL